MQEVCRKNQLVAKLEQERAEKVVKKWPGLTPNWRRPRRQDTKMRSLWPDLEMVARRKKDKGVEGREMRFGESWGTFAAKTRVFRVQQTP
jgi:hypothetical protein